MKILIISTLIFFHISSVAQISTSTLRTFTSLCIAENSTGYNWRNGKWIQTNFNNEKYLFQKIDYDEKITSPNITDRPLLCNKPDVTSIENNGKNAIVKACYSMREFGAQVNVLLDSQNCYESYKNGELEVIQCSNLGNFKPDGLFVKLPSYISMDLSMNKEKKDSMTLVVGKCSILQ